MTATTASAPPRRGAYAALTALLVTAIVVVSVRDAAGWWPIVVFAVMPDVALFIGAGAGLAKGQLHPRAVGLYNALHRFWGPAVLGAAAAAGLIPAALLVGALAWAAHISLDRTVGYGLRTRDGFQRS